MLMKPAANRTLAVPMSLPGKITATSWEPPENLSFEEWRECMRGLLVAERASPWWIGDGWNFQIAKRYGEGKKIAAELGVPYSTAQIYGTVANEFKFITRVINLTHRHHFVAMSAPAKSRQKWLEKALKLEWSSVELRRAIKHWKSGIKAGEKFELATTNKLASVIYADPPWKYDNTGMEGAAADHYPAMTCDELCAMAVDSIVAPDAALFLWVTNPLLIEGLRVMEAWGFEYKTNFVWIKDKPMNSLGFYNRSQHELLLLGTRGSLLPEGAVRALPSSIIAAPKAEHSRKPAEGYELIEGMYQRFIPTMRELFCRGKSREGWLPAFGNQVKE